MGSGLRYSATTSGLQGAAEDDRLNLELLVGRAGLIPSWKGRRRGSATLQEPTQPLSRHTSSSKRQGVLEGRASVLESDECGLGDGHQCGVVGQLQLASADLRRYVPETLQAKGRGDVAQTRLALVPTHP